MSSVLGPSMSGMCINDFDAADEFDNSELYAMVGSAMTLPAIGSLMWFVAARVFVEH